MKQKITEKNSYASACQIVFAFCLILPSTGAFAQATGKGSTPTNEELTRKLNNPVASLISVPFQNNLDVGIGETDGSRNVLNFQPVVPFKLTSGLNLIARVVVPVVSQNNIYGTHTTQTGLSDVLVSTFLSPSVVKNGLTWGAGPAFLIPAATDELLGAKKWGVGPTAVILQQTKGWTFGALANQIWSFAGSDDRSDVSQFYLQPFLTHNWKSGAGLGVSSEITRNWKASTTTAVIIPSISGITKVGTQTVQLNLGPRIPVTYPDAKKPDFGVRASFVLVFPK